MGDGLKRARDAARATRQAAKTLIPTGQLSHHRQRVAAQDHCMSDDDGDCVWAECPQLRDGEPRKTGRHGPRDDRGAVDEGRAGG